MLSEATAANYAPTSDTEQQKEKPAVLQYKNIRQDCV